MKNRKKMILGSVITVLVVILIVFQFKSNQTILLSHRIQINKEPEKVWEVLNDIEAVSEYNPEVNKALCFSSIKEGVGASRECSLNDGSVVKERVIDIEPNKSITMELYESNWPVKTMKWRTAIELKNEGTLVTQTLEYQMKFGAIGAILNSLFLKSKMNNTIQEVFESMKTYIEANTGNNTRE